MTESRAENEPERLPLASRLEEPDEPVLVEFLPKRVSIALILGWIVLFAGRWLVLQGLETAGLLGHEQVVLLDEKLLNRCYVVLLSLSLVVLVWRMVRRARTGNGEAAAETAERSLESDASVGRSKQA